MCNVLIISYLSATGVFVSEPPTTSLFAAGVYLASIAWQAVMAIRL